jgi:hypothetical protein
MNSAPVEMRPLLFAAGFRLRGATRADCVHCGVQSRATVAKASDWLEDDAIPAEVFNIWRLHAA